MKVPYLMAAALVFTAFTGACDNNPASPEVAGVSSTSLDDHDHNNRVDLEGDGVTGSAIVNYSRGGAKGGGNASVWQTTVNVSGLSAGTYTFGVINVEGGAFVPVCSFTVGDDGGRQGCSTDAGVPGFGTAQIRDADGNVVASGSREDRGPSRNPNA
jgi:hypothetical protein